MPARPALVWGYGSARRAAGAIVLVATIVIASLFAVAGCSKHSSSRAKSETAASTRVVLENDKVRVIEYHTGSEKPICGFGMHTHPAHVYVMLTDAKIRIVTPDEPAQR